MLKPKRRRLSESINAGSMADIAFLLLIFFLVTTTILSEEGIMVKLPPWVPDQPAPHIADRNVFNVLVNAEDELLVEGERADVSSIRRTAKEFIMNPMGRNDLARSPNKAVISMQNDRGTSYAAYIEVYNEIKAAYRELWNEASNQRFGKHYQDLPGWQQKEIRNAIPLTISEAEASDFSPTGTPILD